MVSESRKREFEERQKVFELNKRKRDETRHLEDRAHALAWEAESLQYQEGDLSQRRENFVLNEQLLAGNKNTLAHMEQDLNAEREKLAKMEMTFDAQKKKLDWEEQQVHAEEEVVGSLEQEIESRRKELSAEKERLALAQQRFDENDDLLPGIGSELETASSKGQKNHKPPGHDEERLEEDVNRFAMAPSSSNFRPIRSNASGGTDIDGNEATYEGYRVYLDSLPGEPRRNALEEIRKNGGERQEDARQSVTSEHEDDTVSDSVVETHRLAIIEKGKKCNKPIEDTGRIKFKASDIPTDPREAIPDWMKRYARVNSFGGVPLIREIGQYIGEVDWFGEERNLSALLAYMTGEIRKPCTNCQKAADPGNKYWSQFTMCVTSDLLVNGECCHCSFRGAHGPLCSHRSGGPSPPKKRTISSLPSKISGQAASGSQHTPKKVKREKVASVSGSLLQRNDKVDVKVGNLTDVSVFLHNSDEEEVEQSDSIS